MKGSFKVNWIRAQFSNIKNIQKNFKILRNPFVFYAGIILKLFPAFRNKIITLKFKDGKLLRVTDFMSFYIYSEIFVDTYYDVKLDTNKPLIIDVGANTGYFALRMKQMYPEAKIICFEPYPPCVDQIKETIEINKLKNVEIKELAVSDKAEKSKLYIHPTNIAGHSIYSENVSENYVEIESVTLTHVLSMIKPDSKCDLLKLDCEGAEYPIIKSLTIEQSKNFEKIIYEPTYDSYDILALNEHLKIVGYEVKTKQSLYLANIKKD